MAGHPMAAHGGKRQNGLSIIGHINQPRPLLKKGKRVEGESHCDNQHASHCTLGRAHLASFAFLFLAPVHISPLLLARYSLRRALAFNSGKCGPLRRKVVRVQSELLLFFPFFFLFPPPRLRGPHVTRS